LVGTPDAAFAPQHLAQQYDPPKLPPDIVAPERPRGARHQRGVAPPIDIAPLDPLPPEPEPAPAAEAPAPPTPPAPIEKSDLVTETAAQVKFVLDSWIPFAITLVLSDVCRGELQPPAVGNSLAPARSSAPPRKFGSGAGGRGCNDLSQPVSERSVVESRRRRTPVHQQQQFG
jgi:hypothetical protein